MIIKLPTNKTLKRLGVISWDEILERVGEDTNEQFPDEEPAESTYTDAYNTIFDEYIKDIESKLMHILNYNTMISKGEEIFKWVSMDDEHITIRVLNPTLAVEQVIHAINGVGMFHYSSVKEYMYVNSTTSKKKAIEAGIDWLFRLPEIYGR